MPESTEHARAHAGDSARPADGWSPLSWRSKRSQVGDLYADAGAVDDAVRELAALPPLVTSWEIERLKGQIAQAQAGRRFILQGGDCAETLDDCRPDVITNKLKILLQMSLVLVHASKKPVTRIGRIAGQYTKPRSSPTESRDSETLPSYFGDIVNRAPFTPDARRPDPSLMLRGYQHAALTLNFIRALTEGGFADAHHPEYWDLSFFTHAGLPPEMRAAYERMRDELGAALRFMEAMGETTVEQLGRVEFFTSHEGLNLHYESAQTRKPPRRDRYYNLTTHLPWIGERTRALDGAHIEYFRGIANPVGVKIGPATTPDDLASLVRTLNPENEPGKLVLIARMGAGNVRASLPPLLDAARRAGAPVLWACDPMHANTTSTASGVKTRSFHAICDELEESFDAHRAEGSTLGGVHFELTGEDVTECVGGASGLTEDDLARNYASPCDPRLNYHQAMELAFRIAGRMATDAG